MAYLLTALAPGSGLTDRFRPAAVGLLLMVSLVYPLLRKAGSQRARRHVGGAWALGWLIALTVVVYAMTARVVFADNCAGDNRLDCWLTTAAAAWGAIAAAVAGAFAFGVDSEGNGPPIPIQMAHRFDRNGPPR